MSAANKKSQKDKSKLVVIGSGWAGFEIAQNINYNLYDVTVISPRRNTTYTPLLASAATGLFNFSLAEEPIRAKNRPQLRFLKAFVNDVDFDEQTCTCSPAFDEHEALEDEGLHDKKFTVPYDLIAICPGTIPNDFGTEGVSDHAIFMTDVQDAMKVRRKLFSLLEKASLPTVTPERIKEILHIAIVGGGPTGIELTAELDDLCKNELADIYPAIAEHITISVYDVAPNILPIYDAKLHEYATTQLKQRQINVSPDTKIEKVDAKALYIKDKGRVPYGMLLWVTGNKNVSLLDNLKVKFPEKPPKRIQTDAWLRAYKPVETETPKRKTRNSNKDKSSSSSSSGSDEPESHQVYDNVFALGDAADIATASLPTTAEVATQKARYLVRKLNNLPSSSSASPSDPAFKYKETRAVSYIGGRDGVISTDGKAEDDWTGARAWVAWRGGNVLWVRTWRSRVALVLAWVLNWIFGKEIAKL